MGSLLAPLFLDESTPLPNYMKSIQWFNCHKYDMDKMAKAVKQIYNSLVAESKMPQQLKVSTIYGEAPIVPTGCLLMSMKRLLVLKIF